MPSRSALFPHWFRSPENKQAHTEQSLSAPHRTDYAKIDLSKISHLEIAQALGWVSAHEANMCHGYYQEPVLYYEADTSVALSESPVRINFDQSLFTDDDSSLLEGDVQLTQPNRLLAADFIFLNRDPLTHKYSTADAYGNVTLREPGKLLIGDKGHINLAEHSGSLYNVIYRITRRNYQGPEGPKALPYQTIRLDQLSGWGTAKRLIRYPSGVVEILHGTYTTCSPKHPSWEIRANNLKLDKEKGRGKATNARIYFGDLPIIYFPYLNFPIDNRRQSGFLFPSAGNTNNSGLHFSAPLYLNLASNADDTFTPDYMTMRGLQLNNLFRYLTESSTGNIHGSFLPGDNQFKKDRAHWLEEYPIDTPSRNRLVNDDDNRWFISIHDLRHYNDHWSSELYFNRVSDDYYFIDFEPDPAQITENQIINRANVTFSSTHWQFVANLIGFQTLHPITQGMVNNQYRKVPELILNSHHSQWIDGLDIFSYNSATYFDRLEDPGVNIHPVTGARININPGISYPLIWNAGFLNPRIELIATHYNLHDQPFAYSEDIQRTLGIFSVDSGLFFHRYLDFSRHHFIQTLEPRLFYLYIPYINQNQIPLFDTGVQPFRFEQLFRTNRFSGVDRIGDANQVSVALTSRFLQQADGSEKASASIGSILYFENRQD